MRQETLPVLPEREPCRLLRMYGFDLFINLFHGSVWKRSTTSANRCGGCPILLEPVVYTHPGFIVEASSAMRTPNPETFSGSFRHRNRGAPERNRRRQFFPVLHHAVSSNQ